MDLKAYQRDCLLGTRSGLLIDAISEFKQFRSPFRSL